MHVEAEEMQMEARKTIGHDTPMAKTHEGLTQAEPPGQPSVCAVRLL